MEPYQLDMLIAQPDVLDATDAVITPFLLSRVKVGVNLKHYLVYFLNKAGIW